MVRRLTAHQALQHLQGIESGCSNGELCDSEDPLGNDAPPSAVESDEDFRWWLMLIASICITAFHIWAKMIPRDTSVSVPTDVVMKLVRPLFKHGYNVTCDNFCTSMDLAVRLAKEKCSLVGSIRQNHREPPQAAKAKQQLHETTLFKTTTPSTSVTLTCYQCKKQSL